MSFAQQEISENPHNITGYKHIEERKTPELIFAFVEPIGGGADIAIDALIRLLKKNKFSYQIDQISISEIIKNQAEKYHIEPEDYHPDLRKLSYFSEESKRINRLQQQGNLLRKRFKPDFLAKKAMQKISEYRAQNGGLTRVNQGIERSEPLRVAHIVKSIKNKSEYELLKAVYGNMLFLIAVSGSQEQHLANYTSNDSELQRQDNIDDEFLVLTGIDQDEGFDYGQQVRDVFYQANIFLNNDIKNIEAELSRFLGLLFGQIISSPTLNETMMFEAFASSLRSCCLSRQVGAALASEQGELISTGWNDVPRFGGGLARDFDKNSSRALCKNIGKCNSNKNITNLLFKILDSLKEENFIGQLPRTAINNKLGTLVKKSGLSELIEFSRAIHAEMEAILAAARMGKTGLRGSTLFVTTYPCDNCAKHIIASGISKVVYIEPYPKSRAAVFFADCIADSSGGKIPPGKVIFSQFVGISPQSYVNLFKYTFARKNKEDGTYSPQKDQGMPLTNVFLDSFTLYESKIVDQIREES